MFILFTGGGKCLVLSDSIAKYVKIGDKGDVVAFRGDTIRKLTDRIAFGEVDLKKYNRIIVHVGANDLSNLVRDGRSKTVTIFDILHRYKTLFRTIKSLNSNALVLFSSILPRTQGNVVMRPFAQGLNFALEKWCAKSLGIRVFLPSFRWFLEDGQPVEDMFSDSDGIHLRGAGVVQLTSCFVQGLSTGNLLNSLRKKRTRKLATLVYKWR